LRCCYLITRSFQTISLRKRSRYRVSSCLILYSGFKEQVAINLTMFVTEWLPEKCLIFLRYAGIMTIRHYNCRASKNDFLMSPFAKVNIAFTAQLTRRSSARINWVLDKKTEISH